MTVENIHEQLGKILCARVDGEAIYFDKYYFDMYKQENYLTDEETVRALSTVYRESV